MDEARIYDQLREAFVAVFDDDSIELTATTSAKDVPGWDSLTHVRLILTVERQFKMRFSPLEMGELANVGGLVALIKSRC